MALSGLSGLSGIPAIHYAQGTTAPPPPPVAAKMQKMDFSKKENSGYALLIGYYLNNQ